MARGRRTPIGRRSGGGRQVFWLLVLGAAVACALGLAHVWTRVAVLDRSYQLGRARAESEKLGRELATLKVEVASLRSTARLDRDARQKLQMGPAQRVVRLRAESAAAAGAPAVGALASNE
jgi:cell division protein FtsL